MTALTGQDIIDRIRAQALRNGHAWAEETVDTLKIGDLSRPVNGIATTWMATSDAIASAVAAGCDFVISHEPTFWNHLDAAPDGEPREAYEEKRDWIDSQGVTVWRYHDHHHVAYERDPVLDAFFAQLDWLESTTGNSIHARTRISPAPLRAVAEHLGERLGTEVVRVVGDPDLVVSTIAYGGHDLASCLDGVRDAQLIIMGEAREWDAMEYFRDAAAMGIPVAAAFLAHAALETWGSDSLADEVRRLVPGVPVVPVHCPEPFVLRRVPLRPGS